MLYHLLDVFVSKHHKPMVLYRGGPLYQSLHELESCPVSLEHSFYTGPKIGLSLPTLETGSRPLYYLGEYLRK